MADVLLTHIGEKIRAIRKSQKLSIEAVAYSIDAGINYLSQVERGQRNPTIKMLHNIASALGVTLESFLPSRRRRDVKDSYIDLVINTLSRLKPKNRKAVLNILKETVTQVEKL
ncbi:MAG: helix-turn-helix domain-containing protein [Candidatus Margulisbacteria bacterium]|jgi:transcriptional regulator with XRE-family HTH domain|nr:helix-turn-helix domain-containing protein [Candidatus Margulisiibacteriota bacterium]